MANVGKNIKQLRTKNKMTQEEFAQALFVTRQTVSNYETGKSNPDIDTIIKIAELFKVDTNAVIYGPPLKVNQKRKRIWAIALGIFVTVLIVADFLLYKLSEGYDDFFSHPQNILKFSLFPFTLYVVGFFAIHIIGLFSGLKPFNNKTAKIIRIVLLIILVLLTLGTLYFAAFHMTGFIKGLKPGGYHISWPGFFGQRLILNIVLNYPFIFFILGAIGWLFGLIYKEN